MRLPQLDAIRALAIGLVVVEHYGGKGLNAHFPVGAGSLGVGLFFALSGFLITSSLLVDADTTGTTQVSFFKNFYLRRALRLMPVYYLWIAILCALNISPVIESWAWHAAYLSNFWIARGHPMIDFWSLAVEEQFYLVWPMLIALAPRRYLVPVILGTTVFGSIFFKMAWELGGLGPGVLKTLLVANMTELGFGACLAVLCYRRGKAYNFSWYTPQAHRIFSVLAVICAVQAVLFWAVDGKSGPYRFYINDAICAVPFIWLILNAAIGFKGISAKFFANPGVQYIGRISYGIYLTHNLIPKIIVKYFHPLPRWELGAFSIIATLVLCSLSWHYLERPILRLKRHFEPVQKTDGGGSKSSRSQIVTTAAKSDTTEKFDKLLLVAARPAMGRSRAPEKVRG